MKTLYTKRIYIRFRCSKSGFVPKQSFKSATRGMFAPNRFIGYNVYSLCANVYWFQLTLCLYCAKLLILIVYLFIWHWILLVVNVRGGLIVVFLIVNFALMHVSFEKIFVHHVYNPIHNILIVRKFSVLFGPFDSMIRTPCGNLKNPRVMI